MLPSISAGLVQIATYALDSSQAGETHGKELRIPELFAAQVFGACAKALADLPSHEWSELVEIPTWIIRALKQWPKCLHVVSGLVAVLRQ